MVQVILRRDVENLGKAGQVVNVKDGYARNYLLPQGFAYAATPGNLRRLEDESRREARAAGRRMMEAQELAGRLEGRSVTFQMRAGEEGKLFGSVTATDIAEALAADGVEVDRHLIALEEPIRQLGVYKVPVRLHGGVRPEVTVWVVADGVKPEAAG